MITQTLSEILKTTPLTTELNLFTTGSEVRTSFV